MKFTTNSIKSCAARIGLLTEFERIPNSTFETPLVLVYTKGGCVPHLTKDVFKMVTSSPQMLSVSLSSTYLMQETMKDCNINFANFVGMKEYINFLTIHDPASTTPSGFREPKIIPLWTRCGKYAMTVDKYMDIIETFKPDMYVALCDGDTNIDSSRKRISKSVESSMTFFEQCFIKHSSSEALKSSEMLGAIEGYVIDGLHNNGPRVKDIPSKQIKDIVEHTINLLPTEKLKVSMGCWNPLTVLELVELGVDIFDTSYPYIITENLEALTFLCDRDDCNNIGHVISFTEGRYADDFSPICSHCECLTCKNHTKAYLHHLCNVKELLGKVLLMIHNLHQYLEFFKIIRENIKRDTLDDYKKKINLKFKQNNVIQAEEFTYTKDTKPISL
ncbi:hypothetical protein QLX08_007912 [Tetragonisca angustula]|uniref:Queuine tRNA-ribosyltransferase accessory subunit 2 n=1 Tax=Tetragonisca angustula TaxID=166442 RepID=A0AAW0ZNI8_9HYME